MRKSLIILFFTFSSCLAMADELALEATDGFVGKKPVITRLSVRLQWNQRMRRKPRRFH
jgi:hypothetical protein